MSTMTAIQTGQPQPSGSVDALESMFEWAETSLCPTSLRHYIPEPEQDTLDYVFEHVESFTCRQDEKEPDVLYSAADELTRGNSLVEASMQEQSFRTIKEQRIKPFGQRGDLVDFVFENVESYACNEAMPDDVEVYRTVSPTVSPENYTCFDRSKVYDVYDAEDEIQLYFRPQGGKRRRRKGVN